MSTQQDYEAACADLSAALTAANEAAERATDLANELRAVGIAPEKSAELNEQLAASSQRFGHLSAYQFPVR